MASRWVEILVTNRQTNQQTTIPAGRGTASGNNTLLVCNSRRLWKARDMPGKLLLIRWSYVNSGEFWGCFCIYSVMQILRRGENLSQSPLPYPLWYPVIIVISPVYTRPLPTFWRWFRLGQKCRSRILGGGGVTSPLPPAVYGLAVSAYKRLILRCCGCS